MTARELMIEAANRLSAFQMRTVFKDSARQVNELTAFIGRLRTEAASPEMPEGLRKALRAPYMGVFLDGRNEHGSHVLMMPGTNIPGDFHEDIQPDLDNQNEGLAERIISEAEALGHRIQHCVVTAWDFTRADEDIDAYFSYARICPILTEAMYGTPAEQDAEYAKHGGAQP